MTFTFPAEVTSWSHVSARVEFSPRGADVTAQTFEVRNHPIPPGLISQNVPLSSPNARVRQGSPTLHRAPSRQPSLRPLQHRESFDDLYAAPDRAPSPQLSMHSLRIAEEPAAVNPFVDDGDEPEIAAVTFGLDDLPIPVWPRVSNVPGPREPLPWIAPRPLKYYVVLRGYKIGIFIEKWYVSPTSFLPIILKQQIGMISNGGLFMVMAL